LSAIGTFSEVSVEQTAVTLLRPIEAARRRSETLLLRFDPEKIISKYNDLKDSKEKKSPTAEERT
jgi:hypothetical protein